nr:MAG TPA: hypothetical protein [Caudoviricetes sp.]
MRFGNGNYAHSLLYSVTLSISVRHTYIFSIVDRGFK